MKLSDSFIDQKKNNYPTESAAITWSRALKGEVKEPVNTAIPSNHTNDLNLPFITLNLPNATCETCPRDTWFISSTKVLLTFPLQKQHPAPLL